METEQAWTLGSFVHVVGEGFGKLRHVDGESASVDFYMSATDSGRVEKKVSIYLLDIVDPPPNTRCFFRRDGRLHGGRIIRIQRSDGRQEVLIVEGKSRLSIPVGDVFVRAEGLAGDPFEVMRGGVLQDSATALLRANYVREMLTHRGAARGMTGLVSSCIRLFPHQVEVCARIHNDALQRYLLADEVGLGKTIEAGATIRQYLLDEPKGKVLILTPRLLIGQWRRELDEKFHLTEDRFDIELVSHEEGAAKEPGSEVDLLVIDEAHHLAAGFGSRDEKKRLAYETIRRSAAAAERLLLLSATPLLHNEANFLSMLHLIDPALYPLDDLEGFKRRVESRRDFAFRLQAFDVDAPDYILEEHGEAFKEMFPHDEVLVPKIDLLMKAIEDDQRDRQVEMVQEARVHLSETYRLHRRVLRTRRGGALAREFPVRGRLRPNKHFLTWSDKWDLESWLSTWFDLLSARFSDESVPEADYVAIMGLLERWRARPSVLLGYVRFWISPESEPDLDADLSPAEVNALRELQISAKESLHLSELSTTISDGAVEEAWIQSVTEVILEMPPSTVVFCAHRATAIALADALDEALPPIKVARYIDRYTELDELERSISEFERGRAPYLICDRAGEEGRNLQFAGGAIHVDLPWDPNRIEQRIGRLDRYSDLDPVSSTVLTVEDGLDAAWIDLLQEGFGVFESSIATLQHVLGGAVKRALRGVIDRGVSALADLAPGLRADLERERSEITQLENLESLEGESLFKRGFFVGLAEAEEQETSLQKATDRWLCVTRNFQDGIGLGLRIESDLPVRSYYLNRSPTPKIDAETLRKRWGAYLGNRRYTFKRTIASSNPGIRLMRPGEAFFDAIDDLTRSDELGHTFAFWRRCGWLDETVVLTRVVYRVEATPIVMADAQDAVEKRLLEGFFPPIFVSVWLDSEGKVLGDEELLRVLRPPFRKKADIELGSDLIEDIENLVNRSWDEWWTELAAIADAFAEQTTDLVTQKSLAVQRVDRAFSYARIQQNLRKRVEANPILLERVEGELAEAEILRQRIRQVIKDAEPVAETVGLIVVGDKPPQELFG